jgi:hypothetical protein
MAIPYTTLTSAGLGNGSPLKSTIYDDLNRLLANCNQLDTNSNASAVAVENKIKFKNCGGNCTGTCTTVCTGMCINVCTGCQGTCTSCTGSCTSCTSCDGCSGH